MGMVEKINQFVDTMLEEQQQFENTQNEISHCEKEVQNIISKLETQENSLVAGSQAQLGAQDDPEITAIFDKASDSLGRMLTEANGRISEAAKGMTFIQDFEKHFTVAVFGKVKAGKSYIGNFVMGNAVKKTGVETAYDNLPPITVNVYDRGKLSSQTNLSEQPEDDFATGMKETTSTIQWFDLGGLSWFDTPGIGSVTWENEMLAKEYVKNADLVIFACNSDAAGTRQEFAEMHQLYDMEKPILLLLTQSDMYDMDIDDDGEEISILVPKLEKDRNDTEQYMIQTLQEQGMEDLLKYDILTVSAKLALEALKNRDEEMFEQSHMGEFLDKLVAITKNDAAEIKKATPRKRLYEMIDGVIGNFNRMADEIQGACASIEESQRELENKGSYMVEEIKTRVYTEMQRIIQENKSKVEKNSGTVIRGEEISRQMNEAVTKCIQKVCEDAAMRATDKLRDINIQLIGIGDMKMRQDKIAYQHVSVYKVRREPKGLEHIPAFLFKKEYYTSHTSTETRYSTFDIGVNDSELAKSILASLESVFQVSVTDYIESLVNGYYEPIRALQTESIAAISAAVSELEGLKQC